MDHVLDARGVKLLLPEKIYAIPGMECNIYYDNIVTVINPANYVFDVTCEVGHNDSKRWSFIPEKTHVGSFPWCVCVINENGTVARGETEIVVVPQDSGKNEKCSLLLIGASQTAAKGYPDRIWELMRQSDNPEFKMVGTNSSDYAVPTAGGVAHEGYGGWGWNSFFQQYGHKESDQNDGLHPRRPWDCNSRFMFLENGEYKFDFKSYCKNYNHGEAPDVIITMLGINNIFLAKSNQELEASWEKNIAPYMKQMVTEFRRVSPKTHIAFSTLTTGAVSQDAFGANYNCEQTRWQWRLNLDYYHRRLFSESKVLGVEMIPLYVAVDGENGFPTLTEFVHAGNPLKRERQSNAMHPNSSGYRQMGDCIYCYLKYLYCKHDQKA